MDKDFSFDALVELCHQTHQEMQYRASHTVDTYLVVRNWLFGWYIVEFENGNASRTELYGKSLIVSLADTLKKAKLKGISATSLKLCRTFYLSYPSALQSLPNELLEIGQSLPDQSFPEKLVRCDAIGVLALGQMQMYVNYFDRYVKMEDELPTIGMVLYHHKNDALVELTLPKDANIFASKFYCIYPRKES